MKEWLINGTAAHKRPFSAINVIAVMEARHFFETQAEFLRLRLVKTFTVQVEARPRKEFRPN
jgi:hypothetical protein